VIYCSTKMLYRPSRIPSFPFGTPRTVGLLLLAGLLAFSGLPLPAFFSETARALARPFWEIRVSAFSVVHESSTRFEDAERLAEEVVSLRAELDSLRRENYAARTVERTMETLRDTLALPEGGGHVLSSVLLEQRRGGLDALMLDVGITEGVRDRMLVTSPEGISVGYIEHAYQRGSTARLFSSAGVTTNVVLYGTTTVHAILEGRGAGSMTIRAPQDLPLEVGTSVGLPNREGAYLGEVISITFSPEDAFKTAYVRGVLNQYELRYVLVDTTTMWEPPSVPVPENGDLEQESVRDEAEAS